MTLTVSESYGLIVPTCVLGIIYAVVNAYIVSKVNMTANADYTA